MISNGALPAWETAAASSAPRLGTALCARNARSPVCLAMLEDLASDELADGLEGTLGRALVSEDLAGCRYCCWWLWASLASSKGA